VAEAYTHFLAAPRLARERASLAGVPAEGAADPEVGRRLQAFREAICAEELPAEVADAVMAFRDAAGLAGVPLAVRSSATAEDSAAASFAGIHHSSLHCRSTAEVLRAVRECYASLWTPAALAYRRRLGLADDQVACAVVLCAMVGPCAPGAAQVSGVGFS